MNGETPKKAVPTVAADARPDEKPADARPPAEPVAPETGGPKGLEPTRFGDWERKGRCVDF